jgi:hypothetical protein
MEGRRFALGKHRFARQGDDREKNNRPRRVEDPDSIFDIGAWPSTPLLSG